MADVRYEQATRVYPGSDVPAVEALDLHIADGEFMVLVGPSGSGKTTALRMLAGLEEVDAGAVYIGDRDVTDVAPELVGHLDHVHQARVEAEDVEGALGPPCHLREDPLELGVVEEVFAGVVERDRPGAGWVALPHPLDSDVRHRGRGDQLVAQSQHPIRPAD